MDVRSEVIRTAELTKLLQLSRTTIWRMTRDGSLPHPVRLTGKAIGWRRSDIEDWLASRPAA